MDISRNTIGKSLQGTELPAKLAGNSATPAQAGHGASPRGAIDGSLQGIPRFDMARYATADRASFQPGIRATVDRQRLADIADLRAQLESQRSATGQIDDPAVERELEALSLLEEIELIDTKATLKAKLSELQVFGDQSASRQTGLFGSTTDGSPARIDGRVLQMLAQKSADFVLAARDIDEYNAIAKAILGRLETVSTSDRGAALEQMAFDKSEFLYRNVLDLRARDANPARLIEPGFEYLLDQIEELGDAASSSLYAYTRRALEFAAVSESTEAGWSRLMALCARMSEPEERSKTISVLATLSYHRPENRFDALRAIVEAVRTQKPYLDSFWGKPMRFSMNFRVLVEALPYDQQAEAEQFVKSTLPKCIYFRDPKDWSLEHSIAFAHAYDGGSAE